MFANHNDTGPPLWVDPVDSTTYLPHKHKGNSRAQQASFYDFSPPFSFHVKRQTAKLLITFLIPFSMTIGESNPCLLIRGRSTLPSRL